MTAKTASKNKPNQQQAVGQTLPTSAIPVEVLRRYASDKPIRVATPVATTTVVSKPEGP